MDNQHRMIKGYRDLSKFEIDAVNKIKNELGGIIQANLESIELHFEADERCIAIAKTKFQEACMWLIRSITKPETFV